MESLFNRIRAAIGRGRVGTVKDGGPVQLIQVDTGPRLNGQPLTVHDDIPRLAEFGFSSHPPADADVALLCLNGERSNAMIIATGHQASRPTGLAIGDSILYDLRGHYVWLTPAGIIVEAKGNDVTVNNATNITINASTKVRLVTPRLEVTGDVIDHCDSQTATLKDLRDAYDAHKHRDVVAGAALSGLSDHIV